MPSSGQGSPGRRAPVPAAVRRELILDTATRLFTARGVHAVGMDELVAETGLAKMSVYRLFPTKDDLVGAYLGRLAATVLALIDGELARHAGTPRRALHAILDAVQADLARPDFRGCPFGNAAAEFEGGDHPTRQVAREYRVQLLARLRQACDDDQLADRLAVLIDGCYLNAAHLGGRGPAAAGLALARELVDTQA